MNEDQQKKEREYASELNRSLQGSSTTEEREQEEEDLSGSENITFPHPNTVVYALVFGAAMVVDALDLIEFTGFGLIITKIIDIPTLGFLWLWTMFKGEAGPKKNITFQIFLAFLVEMIAGPVPAWSIFVAYVYFKEKNLGKKSINGMLKTKKV